MKCMFIIRSLTGGGAERVVSVLSSHLANSGYEIYVLAYSRTEKDYFLDDKVNVVTMPKRKDNLITKFRRITDMRKIIQRIQPDVIIPFVGTVLYVAWFASGMGKIPFVLTIRNNPWRMPETEYQRRFRDRIAKRSAAIMVQNQEQCDYFDKAMHDKMFVVPNPVSKEFLMNQKDNYSSTIKIIVSAGRLNPQKNQKLLIKAFAELYASHPDIRLYIYGEGPEKNALHSLIGELGLSDSCLLMGRSTDMAGILQNADIFVMTSEFEGMPNALMEAMAVGIPVLSSDCLTGPRSLVDHMVDGVLFKTGDQCDLEEKLEWMIRHPMDCMQMGRKSREKIRNRYTYNCICHQMENMLAFVKGGSR